MDPTMTVRERLLTALAVKEPDRLPINLFGVHPDSLGDWCSKVPSYRPLLDFAREQTDHLCEWRLDRGAFFSRVPKRITPVPGGLFAEHTVETPRGPLTCITNTSPATQWVEKYYIQDDEDVERFFSIPYEPIRPDTGPARELEQAVGERSLMSTGVLDPIGVVAALFTSEDFAIRCAIEKARIKKMLDKVFEHLCDYVHDLLDRGPRSLWVISGAEYATAPLLSPQYFDEFVLPYDAALVDLIHQHGSWACIHCHGRLNGVLERIADTGADALHPAEAPPMGDVPLAEVKRRVGHRLCLIGNVQTGDLMTLSRAEVDRLVQETVRDGAPAGGFILSTCASPFTEELAPQTLENCIQMVESGRQHSAALPSQRNPERRVC